MKIQVQAIRTGYYNHIRRREGVKFAADTNLFIKKSDLLKEKVEKLDKKSFIKIGQTEFLIPSWMKVIDPKYKKVEPVPEESSEEEEIETSPEQSDDEVL